MDSTNAAALTQLLDRLGGPPHTLIPPQALLQAFTVFEAIARHGTSIIVKIDAERTAKRQTLVLSGGPLGDTPFRKDGDDLVLLAIEAAEYFAKAIGR